MNRDRAKSVRQSALRAGCLAVCFLAFASPLAGQSKAYSLEEVLRFLQGGVPAGAILRHVTTNCIDFRVSARVENALRNNGGDAAFVAGLRGACYKGADTTKPRPRPQFVSEVVTVPDTVRETIVKHDTVYVTRDTTKPRVQLDSTKANTLLEIQDLIKSERFEEAAASARRLLAADPGNTAANLLLLQSLRSADEVFNALDAAVSAGADPKTMAALALQRAARAINNGQASKARSDYLEALRFAQLANRLSPSSDAAFIGGVGAYFVASEAATQAAKTRDCSLARLARDNFTIVTTMLPAASSTRPNEVSQLLAAAAQFAPYVSQSVKQYCK